MAIRARRRRPRARAREQAPRLRGPQGRDRRTAVARTGGKSRRAARSNAPIVRKSTAMRSSSTSTACRCGITTSCWRASAASAPSAGSNPPAGCASITAMSPARCAGCSAAHAISPSASSRTARPACARRPPMSRLRSTHRLTVSTRIARGLDPLLRREGAGGAPPRYAPSSSTPSSSTRLPQAGDQLLAVGEMPLLHIENAREAAFLERQHVDPAGLDPASLIRRPWARCRRRRRRCRSAGRGHAIGRGDSRFHDRRARRMRRSDRTRRP